MFNRRLNSNACDMAIWLVAKTWANLVLPNSSDLSSSRDMFVSWRESMWTIWQWTCLILATIHLLPQAGLSNNQNLTSILYNNELFCWFNMISSTALSYPLPWGGHFCFEICPQSSGELWHFGIAEFGTHIMQHFQLSIWSGSQVVIKGINNIFSKPVEDLGVSGVLDYTRWAISYTTTSSPVLHFYLKFKLLAVSLE